MKQNDYLYRYDFLDELIQLNIIYKYHLQSNFDIIKLANQLGIRTFEVETLPNYYEYGFYISDEYCDLYYKDYTIPIRRKIYLSENDLSNLSYYEKDIRFLIAMSLGDLLLYFDNFMRCGDQDNIFSYSYRSLNLNVGRGYYHFRNCENFAASLLMPKDMFLTSLSNKVGNGEISFEVVEQLALEFGVNFKAAYQRVKILSRR